MQHPTKPCNTFAHHPLATYHQHLTLMELLLVIGVLVILAAMFVPCVGRPREKARRVNCADNLKQLGLAILMYSGDNGGYFANTNDNYGVSGSLNLNWYPVGSDDYCASTGYVWACPSSDVTRSYETWSAYRYIGSGLRDDDMNAKTISLGYDVSGNHPDNQWMNALFIDGHFEGAKPGRKSGFNND